ncbi:hypothetical protein V8C35DRAFT_26428 [Trichoderma chlorosporum]
MGVMMVQKVDSTVFCLGEMKSKDVLGIKIEGETNGYKATEGCKCQVRVQAGTWPASSLLWWYSTDRVRRVEIDPRPPILCYVGCVGEWPDWCDWTGGGLSQGGNWTEADRWRCESRGFFFGYVDGAGIIWSVEQIRVLSMGEQGWCWYTSAVASSMNRI